MLNLHRARAVAAEISRLYVLRQGIQRRLLPVWCGEQRCCGERALGGNHALVVSLDTGIRAITFNPAALNSETKIKLNITNNDENITNYVVKGEIVSHYQSKIGLYLDGKTITIGNYWDKNISFFERYQRHKIDRVIYEMDKRH